MEDKRLAMTNLPEDPKLCYTWSYHHSLKNYIVLACTNCRQVYNKLPPGRKNVTIPMCKADHEMRNWLSNPDEWLGKHLCSKPLKTSSFNGTQSRRSLQAGVLERGTETIASLNVRLNKKIESKFRREKSDLDDQNHANLFMTERGSMENGRKFGEKLLIHKTDNLAVFFSKKNAKYMVNNPVRIVCDGTFKYSPRHVQQVYRIFVVDENGLSSPFIVALMNGKTQALYVEMWNAVLRKLRHYGDHQIHLATFDCEKAAINSFRRVFYGVPTKMCVFHVKSRLNHFLRTKAKLATEYAEDANVRDVVRRIGALQLLPPNLLENVIRLFEVCWIPNLGYNQFVLQRTTMIWNYYKRNWIENPLGVDWYTAFDLDHHRTTNHAESFHSRLRNHFPHIKPNLGLWLIINREMYSYFEQQFFARLDDGYVEDQNRIHFQVTEHINRRKEQLIEELAQNPDEAEFELIVWRYLGRIGRLMGYDKEAFNDGPLIDDIPMPLPELDDPLSDEEEEIETSDSSMETSSLNTVDAQEVNEDIEFSELADFNGTEGHSNRGWMEENEESVNQPVIHVGLYGRTRSATRRITEESL